MAVGEVVVAFEELARATWLLLNEARHATWNTVYSTARLQQKEWGIEDELTRLPGHLSGSNGPMCT